MAFTQFQIDVLRLLAERRKARGDSYVAGGSALNAIMNGTRLSQDLDIFHDTTTALQVSWVEDRKILETHGYTIHVIREVPSFVEATVAKDEVSVLIQWTRDSAFRFFPLIEHDILGLTLHPIDLATNKLLAVVGRLEPRDWVDMIACHHHLQPLGYLAWAASGKDPGLNPDFLLAEASRQHYSQLELDTLVFSGVSPHASESSREWKKAISEAKRLVAELPVEQVGDCVLTMEGIPYLGDAQHLSQDLLMAKVFFHKGSIGGAWPQIKI